MLKRTISLFAIVLISFFFLSATVSSAVAEVVSETTVTATEGEPLELKEPLGAVVEDVQDAEMTDAVSTEVDVEVEKEDISADKKADNKAVEKIEIGGLHISGRTELINQNYSVSGSELTFLSQNNLLYHDTFRQRINVAFDGELENSTMITGKFVDLPYLDNVFSISAEGKKYYAHAGDARAKFTSGPMTTFTKNIRGLDFGYTQKNTNFGLLLSTQKSKTQGETFSGRNIRGPYVLRANSIVDNTEVVRVNGNVIPRSEYYMDYFLGEITFNDTLDPGDRVEIHYESEVWLDLSAGDLFGVSVTQGFMDSRAMAGVSYLREKADVLPRAKVFSATSSEQKQNIFDVVSGDYVMYLGQDRLEKNYEIVTALASGTVYLTRDTDYSVDYALGGVTFNKTSAVFAALPNASTITVNFNYYADGYLQWIQDEELTGDGQIEYTLSNTRIYSGTELVMLYEGDALVRQLKQNIDYEINEGNNTIVFLDTNVMPSDSFNRRIIISYEIVPEYDRVSQTDIEERSVMSAFGTYNKGNLNLDAEIAQSDADLRQKTIQVLQELVAYVTVPTNREYLLQHEVIFNSLEVYFNDSAIPSARQRSGTDYVLESDPVSGNTMLRFKADIPLGTTIIANYRFQTDNVGLKDKKGEAGRITANYRFKDLALRGEYMRKSSLFSPLTVYNDLEKERILTGFDYTGIRNLTFNLDYAHRTNDNDLTSGTETDFDEMKASVNYQFDPGKSLKYTLEQNDRKDSLVTSITDNDLTGHKLDFKYKVNDAIKTAFVYETREFNDNTGNTSNREIDRGGVSVDYVPSSKFNLRAALDQSSLTTSPLNPLLNIPEFSIDTFSTRINATYFPGETVTVSAVLDSQRVEDDRAISPDEKLDSIRLEVLGFGVPSRKILDPRSYLVSFYRQTRPDNMYGDSLTDVFNTRVTYSVGRHFLVSPSFVASKTRIGSGSKSKDNTEGLLLQYRAEALHGWSGSTSFTFSSRSGVNVSSSSLVSTPFSNDQSQFSLNLKYMPSSRLTWAGIYQNTGTKNSASTQTRSSVTSRVDYDINDKSTVFFSYNLDNNPGGQGDRTTYDLGANVKLDQHLSLDLQYKRQEQDNSGTSAYDGSMFTMKLIIDF